MTHDLTFQGLHDSGFKHLLPLVPYDADISPDSKNLRPELLGKVPGRLRHNGWVGMADWVHHTATDSDLQQWQDDGAGICMRCQDVVAIDLDITDESLVNMVMSMAFNRFDFAPIRIGNAPKALLLYRLEEPGSMATKTTLSFTDDQGVKHLIEVLGSRQQFVVHGTHPKTGKPYEWDENIQQTGLSKLPVIKTDDLQQWLLEVQDVLETVLDYPTKASRSGDTTARDTEALRGDPVLVAQMVEGIPNGELNGYDELAQMAHAIWAACHPDTATGLEILTKWAAKWPNEPDLSEAERIYDSIRESSIGVQWLADRARDNGVDTAVMDFEEAPITQTTSDPYSFWNRYVYVNQTKRFMDCLSGDVMDKEQFNDCLGNMEGKSAATYFMQNYQPGQFCTRPTYTPGSLERVIPDGYGGYHYNAWIPGPAHGDQWDDVTPSDKGLQMWLQLAEHLFPDKEERDALLDWMAHLLQNPGTKPNWHPLIGSDTHGTGKDSLLIPLVSGLGRNCTTILTGDLEGQWTWWAENTQLVVVSEISSFERRAVMNRLKSFMANPPHTVEINKKGMPQYEVPNLFGMVMFTNNRDAVAIENSDRRFFVLWSEAEPLPAEFYSSYHKLFTDCHAGSRAVVQFLKQRDISGRDFRGTAPHTAAKDAMRREAMPVAAGYLANAIEEEEGVFARDLVTMDEIRGYIDSCNVRPISPQQLRRHLENLGAYCLGRARLSDGGRASLWAVRRVPTYRKMPVPEIRDLYEQQVTRLAAEDFGAAEEKTPAG